MRFSERDHLCRKRGFLHVSVEAIAYVKSLDLGEFEKARLLIYVIGENTLNDDYTCRIGIEQLAYETRVNEKTVRRQLENLASRETADGWRCQPIILRKKRYPEAGGRLPDALRLVGFKRWYFANYGVSKRAHKAKSNGSPSGKSRGPLPDKMSGSPSGLPACPVSADNKVSVTYNRTLTVGSEEARAGAPSEDFKFDLEGKGVRDRLLAKLGAEVFRSWFADVIFRQFDATTAVAETNLKFKRDWLRSHYERVILYACRAEFGADIARVEFVWLTRKGIAA